MLELTEGADQRRQIALVVYPGFKTLEATGPLSVLGYASQHPAAAGRPGGYDVVIAAPEAGPVPSDTLMSLEASVAPRDLGASDTVLIAGAARIEDALVRGDMVPGQWPNGAPLRGTVYWVVLSGRGRAAGRQARCDPLELR